MYIFYIIVIMDTVNEPNLKNILKSLSTDKYQIFLKSLANKIDIDFTRYTHLKTGTNRERLPLEGNWCNIRAASMLVYCLHTPRSVKYIRNRYGGMKNRGSAPDRRYPASGYVHRHLLQDLQTKQLICQHIRGRYTSPVGKKLIIESLNDCKTKNN